MKLNPSVMLFIIGMHSIPIFFRKECKFKKHFKLIIILWYLKCISITVGMHRLWTHRSFNTTRLIKVILMILCNSTFEGSITDWTTQHRMHHRFEHTDPSLDPYSITKGFLWAHIITHFYDKKSDKDYNANYNIVLQELREERSRFDNILLYHEHKYYNFLMFINGIILPTIIFQKYYQDGLASSLVSTAIVSLITWHSTWSVNSFAHLIGDKPFRKEHTAVDNHLVSLITSGEGYHNYHHTYPKDYKASRNLFCFNLTGIIIFLMSKLNLAWDLREANIKSNRY